MYDAEGNRTRIVETPAAGAVRTTELRYEGGRVVGETETHDGVTTTRAFTLDETGAIVTVAITTTGGPVTHDGTYLLTHNGHGDALTLERINADGTLTLANRFAYGTWGVATVTAHNGHPDHRLRYRYVGRFGVADDTTGLVATGLLYMHARHSSPELGRFLQPDPARAETNLYAYGANSPTTKIDPSGTVTFCRIRYVGWLICVSRAATAEFLVVTAGRTAPIITTATDALGRVRQAAATLTPANIGTGTSVSAAAKRLTPRGYDTGHLIARILGGGGGAAARNTVPMLSNVNQGKLAAFEKWLANLVRAGNVIEVRVRPIYRGSNNIPEAIEYSWRPVASGAPWITRAF